ncbi:MAG TPA: ATP-binding protein, partial [Chloroflexota bacterium]
VASNLDLEHVLETVVAALVKDFGAALARIWMYDAHANVLTLEASGGSIETPVSRGEQIDVATTPYKLGSVVRAREPYIRNGLENDPEFDQEWVSRERIEAVAIFPLIMADTLLGVMSLFSRAPLREEMVEALTTFNVIVSASVNDVQLFTAEQQARAQAEVTQDYFAFLADASRVLTSSLDYQITLRNVAELVVPRLADWCAVHIVEDDGSVLPLATTHVDPEKVALAEELGRRYPFDPNTASGVAEVLRTGKPEITPEITDEMLVAGATNDEILAILRDLGFTSAMIVPLLARGRTLGAITYVAAESGRHYGTADLQMAEDLARRAAIAVDNSRLYTQLEEANRARDEFISSVSHDLKNPLATLRAQTQLLQRRVSRQGGEGVQKLLPGLNQLESTTIRMEAMIGDLVDAANIRAGRPLSLLREPVDLVALSRRIAEEQQLSAPRHTIEVQSEAAEMVGQWDARRIERVLWNLLSNAVKYSPDGGTVLLEVKPKETPDGPAALLTVRDQGLGIPAADLPYIFERYRRGGNVTHHIAGTGIGLASVRHIVEQHGGSVTADSHEGRGACFTVWLPMDSSEADSA